MKLGVESFSLRIFAKKWDGYLLLISINEITDAYKYINKLKYDLIEAILQIASNKTFETFLKIMNLSKKIHI